MGRLVVRTYKSLELDAEDVRKAAERRERRNLFPKPTRDMMRFCEKLRPCPICGSVPKPSIVGEYGDYSIKMNCAQSGFHISCGDWFNTLAKAGRGWNRRTEDEAQIRWDMENERRWKEEYSK